MNHRLLTVWVAGVVLVTTLPSVGCRRRPQELPIVVSVTGDNTIEWNDLHGPLRGEVPWVLRTDAMGPGTYLLVDTPDGSTCARQVAFQVVAGGVTRYTVTLVSDLHGKVSWRIRTEAGKRMRLFTCTPRLGDDSRRECLRGGIPKPLFGELVGDFSAELVDGSPATEVRSVRFDRDGECGSLAPVERE